MDAKSLFVGVVESKNKETYFLINKLGEGGTSHVYKGICKKNKIVAVKVYLSKETIEHYNREVDSLDVIKHKNIVKMLEHGKGIFKSNSTQIHQHINFIILEYACHGDIFDFIKYSKKGFGEEMGAVIFKSVLDGLEECYDNGYFHGDLKTENILIDENYDIKLADFGFSEQYQHDTKLYSKIGTDGYFAPEVYSCYTEGFDPLLNDIFSLGVVLFIIVAGKIPFEDSKLSDGNYQFIRENNFKGFWKKQTRYIKLTESFKDLFSKLVDYKPGNRITIRSIKKHPWLISRLDGGCKNRHLLKKLE